MPYQVGYTNAVEKALFLRRFDVPFWALAYVFGQNDQYWYRMEQHFGNYHVVQTTVKDGEKLPKHLLADEKITWLNGDKVVVATTVGDDCVLGACVALSPDADNLTEAYQHFKDEAQQLQPGYTPETVNTDGWAATQRAWLTLFPLITIIECFLHAFIKIRDRCRNLKPLLQQVADQVWQVYHAPDAPTFHQQVEASANGLNRTPPVIFRKPYTNGATIDKPCSSCAPRPSASPWPMPTLKLTAPATCSIVI
jgi:hypothetical protein